MNRFVRPLLAILHEDEMHISPIMFKPKAASEIMGCNVFCFLLWDRVTNQPGS